jgi:glycosyltransferase involved in cell wall biosynthesis
MNHNQQPYVPLYIGALESQGLSVQLEREFSLKWLLTQGKSCDAIHLHTILGIYKPPERDFRHKWSKKLYDNRWTRPLFGALRLTNYALALLLARLQGKTTVYTVHDLTPHNKEAWTFAILRRATHYVIATLVKQIHAHNDYSREFLKTAYRRKNGVQVVPIGNYAGCYPNKISRSEARRKLGLPQDAFVYLFLGMIRPYKGVEDLIAVFEASDLPNSRLLVVGRVSRASRGMETLGQNNPNIKRVLEFVPDEDVQLYMNACDAYVLPYRYVTTSSAIMLAWTFGRPIIGPAIAFFPELVTPETGILYDPDQPNGLAAALQQARERSWSESAILDHVRQFDWDKLGPQLADLYKRA